MDVPFDRSYWVVPGKCLAGCYPGAKRLDEAQRKLNNLLEAGIRCFVSLMEEYETDRQGDSFEDYTESLTYLAEEKGLRVKCLRVPIPDTSIPRIETMKRILDEIDAAIKQGKPVYAHCWGGKGRTGTVVGCWLIRHGKATAGDVLSVIQELRKNDPTRFEPSPENERQRWMVKSWRVGE